MPKPKTRDWFETSIEKIRVELAGHAGERDRIQSAPRDKEEAVAALREEFDRKAERWNPNVHDTGNFALLVPAVHDTTLASQTESMFAALWGNTLFDALAEKLDAQYATLPAGITKEDRVKQLAAIEAKTWDLEKREERLILEAAEAGFDIDRRGEAKPEIVLGATEVKAA